MKIACIYHSVDLDGWMSAAIVEHWFHQYCIKKDGQTQLLQSKEGDILVAHDDIITFIGYNYGQPIPDLSGYDRIIMCDISFPILDMVKLAVTFESNFTWIDHHQRTIDNVLEALPSDCNISGLLTLDGINFAACELTWKYFFPDKTMPEIVRLLGRYDCFGHKGTSEEKKVLEFQYGARMIISNHREAYELLLSNIKNGDYVCLSIIADGTAIYNYLCAEAKQIYENGFDLFLDIPNFKEPTGVCGNLIVPNKYRFICINRERFNPINFGIDYHQDGYDGCACFWYEGKSQLWKFSLYNDNGLVDCSAIAQQFGGGGHKGAAGFVTEDLHRIIKY